MMITYFDFLNMSKDEQFEAVWKGTFLGERRENEIWVQCYSLESFYVEVFYDTLANQILNIRTFTKIEELAVYL